MTSYTTLSHVTVDQSTPPATDDPMTSVLGSPITGDNDSDDERDVFLHERNLKYISSLAPGVTFFSLVMVLGLVGNTIVIVVYYRRYKPSVTRVYILAMAVCDFLTNILIIPMYIVQVHFNFTFYLTWGCKALGASATAPVIFTAAILVAVAVDRQKAVCTDRPRSLDSVRDAYKAVVISALVSLLVACPYAELAGDHTITFPHSNITGVECTVADKYRNTAFPTVYATVLASVYIVCVTMIVVSYARIARYLLQHQTTTTSLNLRFRRTVPNSNPPSAGVKPVPARTSLMLFVFTVVFIINYLPSVVVVFVLDRDLHTREEDLKRNACFIFLRWNLVYSVANPLVYSFFSCKFRNECRSWFYRRTCPSDHLCIKTTCYLRPPQRILNRFYYINHVSIQTTCLSRPKTTQFRSQVTVSTCQGRPPDVFSNSGNKPTVHYMAEQSYPPLLFRAGEHEVKYGP